MNYLGALWKHQGLSVGLIKAHKTARKLFFLRQAKFPQSKGKLSLNYAKELDFTNSV